MKPSSLALSLAALVAFAVRADALPSYVPLIPNGGNVDKVPAVGHSDHTGASGDLDAFGKAFEEAGDKWTAELCKADSDGDGQTNGEELGDPCCTWAVGGEPKFTKGVSNPGDPASNVSASMLASSSCSGDSTTAPKQDSASKKDAENESTSTESSAPRAASNSTSTSGSGNAPTPAPSATSGANSLCAIAFSTLVACLVAMTH